MNRERAAYQRFCTFVSFFIHLFWRFKVTGAERVQDGAAMVCANHSSWTDPFFIAIAFGKKFHLRFMGKAELFRMPVIGWYLKRIGMFPVDRSRQDVTAIRTAMKLESASGPDIDPKVLRNPFLTDKTIICGHTPLKEVFHSDRFHITCIDTGSFEDEGHITVMDLDTGEFFYS